MKLLLASICLLLFPHSFAAIHYVTPSGAGTMNGTSWANAFPGTSLQLAINNASTGDEIWVACGTFKPTSTTNRTLSFSMKNNITIYGGFQGTESLLTERNFLCGPCSILSGEIGAAGTADNNYHVISNLNLNNTAVIDGFMIQDANDDRAPTLTEGLGGGIYNQGSGASNSCNPTIRNCVIINNSAEFGGGIFNNGYGGGNASPVISHCIIANNTATGGGGGIDNFGLNGNANPTIINCIITNNTAADAAGGMYCWGGSGGNANPTVINSVFTNNTVASGFGGGIIADRSNSGAGAGGGSGSANITMINSIIKGNTATTGPQFYTYESGTVMATYSDIDTIGQFAPHISQGSNTGNITADPLFLNMTLAIGLDDCWMTDDDGLQLTALSPCIHTGDSSGAPLLDILFNDRIMGSNVDMGAYEYDPGTMEIENQINNPGLLLFPNPVKDELFLFSSHEVSLVLMNAAGSVIRKMDVFPGPGSISMAALPSGIYYLQDVQTGQVQKIIKL